MSPLKLEPNSIHWLRTSSFRASWINESEAYQLRKWLIRQRVHRSIGDGIELKIGLLQRTWLLPFPGMPTSHIFSSCHICASTTPRVRKCVHAVFLRLATRTNWVAARGGKALCTHAHSSHAFLSLSKAHVSWKLGSL